MQINKQKFSICKPKFNKGDVVTYKGTAYMITGKFNYDNSKHKYYEIINRPINKGLKKEKLLVRGDNMRLMYNSFGIETTKTILSILS